MKFYVYLKGSLLLSNAEKEMVRGMLQNIKKEHPTAWSVEMIIAENEHDQLVIDWTVRCISKNSNTSVVSRAI